MITERKPQHWLLAAVCAWAALAISCNFPLTAQIPPTSTAVEATPGPPFDPLAMAGEYVTGARIVSHDPLDDMRNWNFSVETGSLNDGVFQLQGTRRWQSSFWPKQQFHDGEGLAVQFKVRRANAASEMVFVTGDWGTESFRQVGIYNAVVPKGDLFQGSRNLGGYDLISNLALLSDRWYNLLLMIGQNGQFLAVLWDPEDSSKRATYDVLGGVTWAGRGWVFLPKVNEGETLYVDDFYRIALDNIK